MSVPGSYSLPHACHPPRGAPGAPGTKAEPLAEAPGAFCIAGGATTGPDLSPMLAPAKQAYFTMARSVKRTRSCIAVERRAIERLDIRIPETTMPPVRRAARNRKNMRRRRVGLCATVMWVLSRCQLPVPVPVRLRLHPRRAEGADDGGPRSDCESSVRRWSGAEAKRIDSPARSPTRRCLQTCDGACLPELHAEPFAQQSPDAITRLPSNRQADVRCAEGAIVDGRSAHAIEVARILRTADRSCR